MAKREIRWSVVVLATVLVAACMAIALHRIHVESDLTRSIPAGSPVLESGRRLLAKHPLIDWVAIDISLKDSTADTARLVAAASTVQTVLRQSGQFASVGNADWVQGIAALHGGLTERLPSLFSRQELDALVLPRLTDGAIRTRLEESYASLSALDGVGQAGDIAADPLGLSDLVYARLSGLFPKTNARVEQNHLVSADGMHLLLTAVPHHALGDPESSRRIATALDAAQQQLDTETAQRNEASVALVTSGAYRAAMDNEAIVKRDTNRAVWLVTVAVSLLLLGCFSRPLLGLLTLLPATAGVALALLLYSFFRPSLSALSLGFGAALISITVDQGIVYIAYLDRVRGATGESASKQTFSAVSLATLTTVGAFFSLKYSGYPLLEELGIFAALGCAFSFAFVHTVFPLAFRAALPTERRPLLPIDRLLRWFATGRVWVRVAVAVVMAVGLGAFARPRFEVDLNRLNTVSLETRAAETLVRGVWGDMLSRAYLLLEAKDPSELQQRGDALAELFESEQAHGVTQAVFSPAQLWPGQKLAERHLADWRQFWNESRRTQVKLSIQTSAVEVGFSAVAFDSFLRAIDTPIASFPAIPREAYSLLGLARARDDSGWVWLGSIERGPNYDAGRFAAHADAAGFSTFDGNYFGRALNEFLGTAFQRMFLIVAPFVLLAVCLSFQSLRLVLLVLFPVVLALIATLGTFGLMGRPIDIPGLMIAVVVLGMGTNFSVYLVNAHQRYPDPKHPVHDSVRIAALLDGGATVLGMSVMAASAHVAARSAGLSGLFGIGFSLFGALFLLPPILQQVAAIGGPWPKDPRLTACQKFLSRFRFLEPRWRWAARRALRSPARLEALTRVIDGSRHLLVIGDGCSIEVAWVLASCPQCSVSALVFDSQRSEVIRSVLGDRGTVIGDDWPAVAGLTGAVDAVLVLDGVELEVEALDGHATRSAVFVLATGSPNFQQNKERLKAVGASAYTDLGAPQWYTCERARADGGLPAKKG